MAVREGDRVLMQPSRGRLLLCGLLLFLSSGSASEAAQTSTKARQSSERHACATNLASVGLGAQARQADLVEAGCRSIGRLACVVYIRLPLSLSRSRTHTVGRLGVREDSGKGLDGLDAQRQRTLLTERRLDVHVCLFDVLLRASRSMALE